MHPVLERLPVGGRVAVIRLRSLGDCVLTTPALQLLQEARPDLRLAVVVEPRFAAVFNDNPNVTAILDPSAAGLTKWHPHLAINFHGGTRSLLLTLAARARYRAGFGHYRMRGAYNVVLPRAQEVLGVERRVHTAEHLASAMFYLGVPRREIPRASLYAPAWPHPRPYVLIHPFASAPDKAWPAGRFAEVARHLRKHGELEPVILCGPIDDPSAFTDFTTIRNAPLREVKSAIGSASLFIGNDSGPAHMAAASGIPVVVLFGPSDRTVWAPWRPVAAEVLASPAISEIRTADVLQAVANLRVRA